MRICLVSAEYPPETGGGIGTQTFLKAKGLSALGHDVHVLTGCSHGRPRQYKDGSVTIHRIITPRHTSFAYSELSTSWLMHSAAVAESLHDLATQLNPNVIQFPEYGAEGFVYQTETFLRRTARYVVQLHGPLGMFVEHMAWPERGSTFDRIGTFMERMVMHHADRLLASSHVTASFCARHYDLDLSAIEVVHSAVDSAVFVPGPPGGPPSQPRILFVGNLAGNKGFPLLVDAALNLLPAYPQLQVRLIGTGDNDQLIDEIQERIADAGAASNFAFLGHVPHAALVKHYGWCDIFAGPSTYEPGPGNVYLEAMACARPVVACASGGTPEIVLENETGLLITPGDVGQLTDALVRLVGDPALRQRLGARARAIIEQRFTIERYSRHIERLYLDLLD